MELDIFVNYITDITNNTNINDKGKIIKLKDDIDVINLQKYLCKKIKNCFLFIDYYDNYYENIVYQCYNNNIYGIIKKDHNIFYIWKIKS